MENQPKRGFAVADNARRAAQKNHELGTAHRFDSEKGREAGLKSAEKRWGASSDKSAVTQHC